MDADYRSDTAETYDTNNGVAPSNAASLSPTGPMPTWNPAPPVPSTQYSAAPDYAPESPTEPVSQTYNYSSAPINTQSPQPPAWDWAQTQQQAQQPQQMPMPMYSAYARRSSWKDKLGSVTAKVKASAATAAQPQYANTAWGQGNADAIAAQNALPQAVVKVMSVRGLENLFMTINLWFVDAALLIVALAIINGEAGFDVMALPIATVLVCLPIFSFFFIRMKRAEMANPALRYDPSKRRMSHITQVFTFLVCVFNLISFTYNILQKIGSDSSVSIGRTFLNMVIILVFMGGIFAYYWFDEHRTQR